jgi:hypothetical protein
VPERQVVGWFPISEPGYFHQDSFPAFLLQASRRWGGGPGGSPPPWRRACLAGAAARRTRAQHP